MMYPILCKVHYEELGLIVKDKGLWKQLSFSFVVNWLIAPLVMVRLLLVLGLMAISSGWRGHFSRISRIIGKVSSLSG